MSRRIVRGAGAWALTGAALLALTLAAGCPAKFVSDYDPQLDKQLTEFQKKVETFINKMAVYRGKPEGRYENNTDFYQKEVPVEIKLLLFRANLQDKNQETITMIELLQNNLKIMEELHKDHGYLSERDLKQVQRGINTSFRSLMLFEQEKRTGRGEAK
ncbi:MAG: hypothetical protein AB1814_02265 [Thermodesulfobacteriota bacterium]